jgi:hypothetical protein
MFEPSTDLANYLTPNERVLWEGRGKRRLSATSSMGITFALVFGGAAAILVLIFVIVGMTSAPSTRGSPPVEVFIILPIIFLIVGLSVGLPLLLMGRQAGNARYVVTTATAMIVSQAAWTGKRVAMIPLKNISQVSLTENRDGTGTLAFGPNPFSGYGRYSGSWLADTVPTFANIERPLEVYQLIRKQMSEQ